ncbi:MbcA/ParS/Xre antitoxin family protein [Marinobacter salarius]|uniref:MbcA/ParS/Xre antitoxin family protein n=1 Tax=Marinobacter salarius TaxID=1420917 RepID=UPI00273C4C13|nr:MbcA/ParS/Xre antitoxin family protein [Marinobacter salarius]MDP4533715.1 MbcA/ParS/Xre antitoxin family protein [Marinobacter salarius]
MLNHDLTQHERRVALKGFFSIAKIWDLSETEQKALLCIEQDESLGKWQKEGESVPPWKVIERISCIFGIYIALRTIFPTEERAAAWVRKPNRQFDGKPAIEVMLDDPYVVRRYLDAQLQ